MQQCPPKDQSAAGDADAARGSGSASGGSSGGDRSVARTAVVVMLLAATGLLFVWRGPLRAVNPQGGSGDFAVVYGATRAWLTGQNPYDYQSLAAVLRGGGFDGLPLPHPTDLPALYPPPTFVVLAPFAVMPWTVAKLSWLILNLAALAVLAGALLRVRGMTLGQPRAGLLIAAVLALAGVHSGIALGQLALVPTSLMVVAVVLDRHGWSRWAGGAAALATAIKPHLGGVLLLWLLLRGCRQRVRALVVAVLILAALTGAGAARLQQADISWWRDLKRNVYDFTHGGIGDPTRANPLAHQLINLHLPLHAVTDNRAAASAIVYTLVVAAGAITLLGAARSTDPDRDWLCLSILAVLSLLAVPHRHYDAVLVALPLAWCVQRLSEGCDRLALLALLALGAFLTPGGAMVWLLAEQWQLAESVTGSWWWRGLVVPHQAWALVAVCAVLLGALWVRGRQGRPEAR